MNGVYFYRRNNGTHDTYSCGKTVVTNGFPDVIASFVTDLSKIFCLRFP